MKQNRLDKPAAKVLVVDDDHDFLSALAELIEALGCEVTTADSLEAASRRLDDMRFEHVMLDLMLPDGSGLQLLPQLEERGLQNVQVTIITGHPAIRNNIKHLHGPNISYLIKPISMEDLRRILTVCESDDPAAPHHSKHFGVLVGESPAMQALYDAIERVAQSSANVMLLGESGVGKELVAEAIHRESGLNGRFVAANCGAFNRELIGSELFGHEKGAFTGASNRKIGLFEQAANGTLLLDEITEMPLELQPALLRVIEAKNFVRLGATTPIKVSCRIISATNRDKRTIVAEKVLREDLLFRLAVFPINIPPLREREGDVPLLASYFLDELNGESGTQLRFDERSMRRLEEYDWPGNIRELRHTIHRAYIMSNDSGLLELPEELGLPFASDDDHTNFRLGQSIEEVERNLIEFTLEKFDGDKRKAAEVLGVSLKTLYNRLKSYKSNGFTEQDGEEVEP